MWTEGEERMCFVIRKGVPPHVCVEMGAPRVTATAWHSNPGVCDPRTHRCTAARGSRLAPGGQLGLSPPVASEFPFPAEVE